MIGEEPKIEKPEPIKEITPAPEVEEEKFDVGKHEKRAKEHRETRQELEKEGQEKDLQLFGEFKEKYSSDLEPEVFERTEEHLKKEKYEPGEEGAPKEKVEEKIEKDKEPEINEELKEYFKNSFLELLKEQVEKTEEFKRKREPFFGEIPPQLMNYLIVQKALENLADDPKMPRKTGTWLKAVLMGIDVERAFIKEDSSDAHKEHFELGPQGFLMNGLGAIFPKDLIKRLESIRDKEMRIRKTERE